MTSSDLLYCTALDAVNLASCKEYDGLYCYSYVNETVTIESSDKTTTEYQCQNPTTIDICPGGYYCIDGNKYECDISYYCPAGFDHQRKCLFYSTNCSTNGLSNQNEIVTLILCIVVLTSCMIVIKTVANVIYYTQDMTRKVDFESLKQQQAQYLITKKELSSNLSKKLLRANTFKLNSKQSIVASQESNFAKSQKYNQIESQNTNFFESINKSIHLPSVHIFSKEVTDSIIKYSTFSKKTTEEISQFEYRAIKEPIFVSFLNMNLNLKKNNKLILNNICASFEPFEVTAIMGPSGSGKTSLLTLLRGEAYFGTVSGTILVNKNPVDSLLQYSKEIAYVPQDDIIYVELSVEENLEYAAILYNKRGFVYKYEVSSMVYYVLQKLEIMHIKKTVVGSPDTEKGISGGQKRLVSIGIELMKEASLFFLDEPTSGLDAATAIRVMNVLHYLSSLGVTVVSTIHQPRLEIFRLMDRLLLLAPGGRVAYYGEVNQLLDHFKSLHYTCNPELTSIADYVMDVLCGFVPEDNTTIIDVQKTITDICDFWEQEKYPTFNIHYDDVEMEKNISIEEDEEMKKNNTITNSNILIIYWKIFVCCFDRQVRLNFRNFDVIMMYCYLFLFFGLLVSVILGSIAVTEPPDGNLSNVMAQVTSGQLIYAMLLQAVSARLFLIDRLMRYREFESSVLTVPYYLGKVVGNFVEYLLYSFAFNAGYYSFLNAAGTFRGYWITFFLLHLAISGLVNFIVILSNKQNPFIYCVASVVLFWAFGGANPSYEAIKSQLNIFGEAISVMSPFHYSYQLESIIELQTYPSMFDMESALSSIQYSFKNKNQTIIALLLYWICGNVLAMLCIQYLYYSNHFKILKLTECIRKFRYNTKVSTTTS